MRSNRPQCCYMACSLLCCRILRFWYSITKARTCEVLFFFFLEKYDLLFTSWPFFNHLVQATVLITKIPQFQVPARKCCAWWMWLILVRKARNQRLHGPRREGSRATGCTPQSDEFHSRVARFREWVEVILANLSGSSSLCGCRTWSHAVRKEFGLKQVACVANT
jgi:hypothetical protein